MTRNPVHINARRREGTSIDRRAPVTGGSPLKIYGLTETLSYTNPTADGVASVQMSDIDLTLEDPATIGMSATVNIVHNGGGSTLAEGDFFSGKYWLSAYFVVDGVIYRGSPVAIRRWDSSTAGEVSVSMNGVHSLATGSHTVSLFIESNLRQSSIRAHLQLLVGSTQAVSSLVAADERTALVPADPITWTPEDLGVSLFSWYDASDDDSFTFSSGTTVSQWNDLSGNSRHLTNGSAERDVTINNLPAVDFTRASSHYLCADVGLTGVISKPFTLMVIARAKTIDGNQGLCVGFTSGGSGTKVGDGRIYKSPGGNVSMFQGTVRQDGGWATKLRSVVATFNGASSNMWVDGKHEIINLSPGTGNAAGIFRVGHYGINNNLFPAAAGEYWNGQICEIAVVSGALSTSDRDEWFEYSEKKWNVALTA